MNRHILLLLLVLACGVPRAQGATLFQDNFTGGKSSLWKQVNDGTVAGSFRVEGGAYVLRSASGMSSLPRALVTTSAQKDYFLQADVRIQAVDSRYAEASLVSYYINSTSYYDFSIDIQNRYWSLRRVDKSGDSLLARGPVPGSPRQLFRVGLYCRQGDLRAFLDGVQVAGEFDPRRLAGGGFGLSSRGAETRWDNVLVRDANPLDFFYGIQSAVSDSSGNVAFNATRLTLIDVAGHAVPGIRAYRIRRDGLSYFAFQDPGGKLAARSGFLSEFEPAGRDAYRVALSPSGDSSIRKHAYDWYELQWLFDFVQKSARIVPQGASADLKVTRNLYLRQGTFQESNTELSDTILGSAGEQAEVHGILYGAWEAYGDFRRFPSFAGAIGNADQLIRKSASVVGVPANSKFALHVLRLSAGGGPSLSIAWLVQDDSRAFVLVDSAGLPTSLRPGGTYTVPYSLLNTGESAGAFELSVVLSRNSFPGPTDIILGHRSFSGLAGGGRNQSELQIQVPGNVPAGRYFIATLLEITAKRSKILHVHNGNFVRPAAVGNLPPPGRLNVSLSWTGPADLDLHVTDPMGETIYYFRPKSDSGGSLASDRECGGGTAPEVVDYPNGTAVPGTYAISVHYFRSCGAPQSVSWTVTVSSDQGSRTYNGTIRPGDYIRAADYTR